MESEDHREGRRLKDPWYAVIFQLLLPLGFTLYTVSVVAWIGHLILSSRKLEDVPSASIAISIVAIPVFLPLLGVFWYVCVGVLFNQREEVTDRVDN